jgi:hypothetical protein
VNPVLVPKERDMIRKGLVLFSTFLVLITLAACGGNGTPGASPTAPTGGTSTPAVAGATINGRVVGLAGSSGAGLVGALDAVTVTATVGGVTVTATIDGQGKFVISGLPAGTVTLSFSGTGATVRVENVGKSENVKIVVVISGGTATLDEEERQIDGKVELEGRISAVPPVVAAGTFSVGDTLVTVGSATVRQGETLVPFETLEAGDRVHVRGVPGVAPNTITAELVIVQNTNANVPANLKGTIAELVTGTACPALEFKLTGWTVAIAGSTTYSKGKGCADLAAGISVHVKGKVVAGKVQATSVQFDK